MPTYEYQCTSCEHEWEDLESYSQKTTVCPDCGEETAQRQIGSGGGIIFKGSGFYVNDYKKSEAPGGFKGDDGGCRHGH